MFLMLKYYYRLVVRIYDGAMIPKSYTDINNIYFEYKNILVSTRFIVHSKMFIAPFFL